MIHDDRLIATILCGLRRVQKPTHGTSYEDAIALNMPENTPEHDDHFTDEAPVLSTIAIDTLCEDLNLGEKLIVDRAGLTKDDALALLDWILVQEPDSDEAARSVERQRIFCLGLIDRLS